MAESTFDNNALNSSIASLFVETEVEFSTGSIAAHGYNYFSLDAITGYHPIALYTKKDIAGGYFACSMPCFESSNNKWYARMYNLTGSSGSIAGHKLGVVWKKDE